MLEKASAALDAARLLTLHGTGGIGKTTLAEQLAALHNTGPVTARWVALGGLPRTADAEMLEQTIAAAFGLPILSTASPWAALIEHLANRDVLLVLDKCEHLTRVVRTLVTDLLQAAPGLRVLATSRAPLGARGEVLCEVPGMTYPRLDETPSPIARYEALELLEIRAREHGRPIAKADRALALRLCALLEGWPEPIELAAARLSTMSLRDMVAGLSGQDGRPDNRFRLLTAGPRTLRDIIDWDHDLCSETERLVWARASVFVADFDQQAAKAVCCGAELTETEVEDTLATLVTHSLLRLEVHPNTGATRYRARESLRVYGLERLAERREVEECRTRHLYHYRAVSGRAAAEWVGPAELELLEEIRADVPNYRAALDWADQHREHAPAGLEITVYHGDIRAGFFLGSLRESRRQQERFFQVATSAPRLLRLVAVAQAGLTAFAQGDPDGGTRYLEQARVVTTWPDLDPSSGPDVLKALGYQIWTAPLREDGPIVWKAGAWKSPVSPPIPWEASDRNTVVEQAAVTFLAGIRGWLVDTDPAAAALLGQAREQFTATGRTGAAIMAELLEAMTAALLAGPGPALEITLRCLETAQATGAPWATDWANIARSMALQRHGDPQLAADLVRVVLAHRHPADRWATCWGAHTLAWARAAILRASKVHVDAGSATEQDVTDAEHVARLLGGCAKLRKVCGVALMGLAPFARPTETAADTVCTILGSSAYQRAYDEGQSLDFEAIMALATGEALAEPGPDPAVPWHTLTPTEQEIALLVADGLTNVQIAKQRVVSIRTVGTHVSNILHKLGVHSRREIAQLIPPDLWPRRTAS